MDAKKVTSQSFLGQKGIHLIERVVSEMGYLWRPTPFFDVGIDGEIEIRDPSTGEATGSFIKVQSKATENAFQAESENSFEFTCNQRDLDYWMRGNAPVILIVSRPQTDEAYWVSIKDYFRDLATIKTRKVVFDKQKNRFDSSSSHALKSLAIPPISGIYFAPLQKEETLYSNLLLVKSFAPNIFVAETDYRTRGELWTEFNAKKIKIGGEWILKDERILSLHNLENPPFDSICDVGTLERFDAQEWAESTDEDTKRDFVRLLNLALRERTWQLGLRFEKDREYYFFPPTRHLKTRKFRYPSLKRHVSREVFRMYGKMNAPNELAYCRHAAFRGYFLRLGEKWYLEITPTYHFTWDGKREDKFSSEHVQGIKRLERNPAVFGQLLMWTHFLKQPTRDLFSQIEYPFLSFGDLERVELEVGLPDDVWYAAEEGQEAESLGAAENQLTLHGL